jgi:hypothetical protein
MCDVPTIAVFVVNLSNVFLEWLPNFNINIIIIIIIFVIAFMQGIYNCIPEINRVYRVCSVAVVLYIQFMIHVMFFRP